MKFILISYLVLSSLSACEPSSEQDFTITHFLHSGHDRTDKLGNILHCVEYCNNDGSSDYAFFEHLSSALDFIHSNFK